MGTITSYNTLSSIDTEADLIPVVDVDDTSMSPSGTTKKITISELLSPAMPVTGGTFTGAVAPAVSALTGATSTAVDAALGDVFNLTLTSSSWTIANPTNPLEGQVIRFRLTQGTGGSFTVAWGSAYKFGSGSEPTLSTAAGDLDIVAFEYVSSLSSWCYLGSVLGF
jgi:hypothetical protein